MLEVGEIIREESAALAARYVAVVLDGMADMGSGVPIQEIMHLAAKLKRQSFASTGKSAELEKAAARHYEDMLARTHPELYARYIQALAGKTTPESRRAAFAEITAVCPDTPIRTAYIEHGLALDLAVDRPFIDDASRIVAMRRAREHVRNLTTLVSNKGAPDEVRRFLNIRRLIVGRAASIVFEHELWRTLARGCSGTTIEMIFYKCLRLTHDKGEVSFYPGLDDYEGVDKDGCAVMFPSRGEVFQLDTINAIVADAAKFGLQSKNTIVICDFDLYKFEGYSVPGQEVMEYTRRVKDYLRHAKLSVILQTDFFAGSTFLQSVTAIERSITCADGRFIAAEEFATVERAYFEHYSKSMVHWSVDRSRCYSVRSVARNIAEGLVLSLTPSIVFAFNESLVNGVRFNLATSRKIPFAGLRKRPR
jgi:hypothetical protein